MLIANRFEVDVCSVYLLEPDRNHLMLAATVGLRHECVGQLRMSLHEGLAGYVAEQLRPLAVREATEHPRFKYFKETGEDSNHSLLGVPLIEQGTLQGVLVVQTIEPRSFTEGEVERLLDAAVRLGPVVSEARTPRRPLEASGTSGQKVVLNGGLNLSVLDGWWAEAFDGANGFAIGSGAGHVEESIHDERDGEALY